MSEHAAAPAPAPAAAPAAPKDPVRDLAEKIYVEMAAVVYSRGGQPPPPTPKAVAMMSFKLAEAFLQAHLEINAAIIAEAKKRSSFSFDDFDLGAGAGAGAGTVAKS